MKTKRIIGLTLALSCFSTVWAAPVIELSTILTDNKESPTDKHSFSKETPVLYIIWKSDQLKEGQTIKNVWIAEDTHNVAPPNYKIDSSEMNLNEGAVGALLSHLPGSYWQGTFSLSKPNNGWPAGTYHAEIYVNDQLVKSVPFTIGEETTISKPTSTTKSDESWDAIAVDTTSEDTDMAFGIGSGSSKKEAEESALKFCNEAEGESCSIVLTFQQCGAYAASADNKGTGTGKTKEEAEQQALSECKATDCKIIASDCTQIEG